MKSKSIPTYALLLLILTLILAVLPTDAEAAIYEDTLRLHILARSDSKDDQALKLEIRDFVLEKYSDILLSGNDASDAYDIAAGMTEEIKSAVDAKIKESGYNYTSEVTVTEEWYQTRSYGDFSLPAGRYKSLRIILGGGAGQNWWCVMFPPLCKEIATERAPSDDALNCYTDEEITLIKGAQYQIKFKILEIFANAFSKNS